MATESSSNLRRFGKDSLIYGLNGVANRSIGIILLPIYTRVFAPSEYGVIDLITTTIVVLSYLSALGLDLAMGRYYGDAADETDRRLTCSTSLLFLVTVLVIIVAIALVMSEHLAQLIFQDTTHTDVLVIALIAMPLTVLNRFFGAIYRWRLQPGIFTVTSVGLLFTQSGLAIYLVLVMETGIIGVFYAILVSSIIFSILNFCLTRASFSLCFSFGRLRQLLHYGLPLVPVALISYLMFYSDRYFLQYFLGSESVGIYGTGARLASLMILMVGGVQLALAPFVIYTYQKDNAREIFSRIFDYVSVSLGIMTVVISVFSREILQIFAGSEYSGGYVVVPFLVVSIAMFALGGWMAFGIEISKKTGHRLWTSTFAAGVNCGLNFALIPHYGIIGAASSTTASFALLSLLQMSISQKLYHVPYHFRQNLLLYAAVIAIISVTYAFLMDSVSSTNVLIKCALVASFLAVPFALRLVGRQEIDFVQEELRKHRIWSVLGRASFGRARP